MLHVDLVQAGCNNVSFCLRFLVKKLNDELT